MLVRLWDISGFIACAKRLSGCGISVGCGVYSARCLILAGCSFALMARAMFAYALAKLRLMISNNVSWLHVFVLNGSRTLRKLVWLLLFPMLVNELVH